MAGAVALATLHWLTRSNRDVQAVYADGTLAVDQCEVDAGSEEKEVDNLRLQKQ